MVCTLTFAPRFACAESSCRFLFTLHSNFASYKYEGLDVLVSVIAQPSFRAHTPRVLAVSFSWGRTLQRAVPLRMRHRAPPEPNFRLGYSLLPGKTSNLVAVQARDRSDRKRKAVPSAMTPQTLSTRDADASGSVPGLLMRHVIFITANDNRGSRLFTNRRGAHMENTVTSHSTTGQRSNTRSLLRTTRSARWICARSRLPPMTSG